MNQQWDKRHAPPALVRLSKVKDVFGFSRATAYREAAKGNIVLLKIGTGTFVQSASVLRYIENLPAATIRKAS